MKKSYKLFPILALCCALLLGCAPKDTPAETTAPQVTIAATAPSEGSPLDNIALTLPQGMERQRTGQDVDTLLKNGQTAGGLCLLPNLDFIFEDVLSFPGNLHPVVQEAMKALQFPEMEWNSGASTEYGLYRYEMGNAQCEYTAYVLRGNEACYLVWFDCKQIPQEEETAIMASLQSDDITPERNMISQEAMNAAISQSMAQKNYRFVPVLPAGMTQQNVTEDGALYYQGEQLIGGYKVVHFENGILPAAKENLDFIVSQLITAVKEQMDFTGYETALVGEQLPTIAFRKGDCEYTHYIYTFGQAGTQYDIWLDTTILDDEEAISIVLSSTLEEIP